MPRKPEKFLLNWSDYKSFEGGKQTLFFKGGLQISVSRKSYAFNNSKRWRVFVDGKKPVMESLQGTWATLDAGKLAVEKVMIPIIEMAPKIVRAEVKMTVGGIILNTPVDRR